MNNILCHLLIILILSNVLFAATRLFDPVHVIYNHLSDLNVTDLNMTVRRRLKEEILDFKDKNTYLMGVAAISDKAERKKTYCSGALVKPPDDVSGYFVLSAAHCMFVHAIDPARLQTMDDFMGQWDGTGKKRVEFGVKKGHEKGKDKSVIQCDVEDYFVHGQWPLANTHDTRRYNYDFGVMKLTNCNGGAKYVHHSDIHDINPKFIFTMQEYNPGSGGEFMRAGYGGKRHLHTSVQTRIEKPTERQTNPSAYVDVLVHFGEGKNGDSGGPIFDKTDDHYLRAVYNGQTDGRHHTGSQMNLRHRGVVINKRNYQIINDMMRGIGGFTKNSLPINSHNTCEDLFTPKQHLKQCWGECLHRHDNHGICHASEWTKRPYVLSQPEWPCGLGQTRKLCGSIPKCDDSFAEPYKHCMGPCVAQTEKDDTKYCPPSRTHLIHKSGSRVCKENAIDNGYSYICVGKNYNKIPDCSTDSTTIKCWSKCGHKHKYCYTDKNGKRGYFGDNPPKQYCGGSSKLWNYLCGRLQNCVGSFSERIAEKNENCWGKCDSADRQANSCPSNRKSFRGVTLLCTSKHNHKKKRSFCGLEP